MFVDRLVLGGQRLAGPQLFQHVIHVGQGQPGMLRLLALAVRVQLLGQGTDARRCASVAAGKGNLLKHSEWL